MAPRRNNNPDDFCLPDLGEGLEEAELIEWCVHVGQRVEENDVLAKMETAKALVEVPSPRGGTIAALHGKPGEAIKVGAALVTYHDESDSPAALATEAEAVSTNDNGHSQTGAEAPRRDAGTVVGSLGDTEDEPGKVRAAPAVRRLARDMGVELSLVSGSGIGGRITRGDVEAAAAGATSIGVAKTPPSASPVARKVAPVDSDEEIGGGTDGAGRAMPAPRPASAGDVADATRTPFRGVRRTIAEHLRHSVSHAVHYTVMDEADVSSLDELRRKLMGASNEKISFLPFVAFAVCRVLSGRFGQQLRRLNSSVDDQAQEIVQHRPVHLGIATDTDSGLMVPVIRNADRMGVLELSRQIAHLAKAARERTISAGQLSGSTFTISNFGALGGRFGTPIINYPEAGILAMGRAREGVVVRRGMLGVGKLLPLSLSADHRVIDGATAATALARIIELLQSPDELLPAVRSE
ncbi:MAG TPA: dihydrolipoamide acetyltransferase family protein [Tepidisphaeraceae bacterium]|jgi:pyruvate dehydrogenase E2 component (dihydrolipoamide acetyltransferase)|nr:dihydrolipoamide acetyltransferase family protein [Tepidisphaeraceae bacterium]